MWVQSIGITYLSLVIFPKLFPFDWVEWNLLIEEIHKANF